MKRSLCILMSVVLCFVFLSVSASAETYDLSDTDLSIRLDDTVWYVFTRDNIENNPELEELGVSYDAMYDILYENEVYMDAVVYYEDGEYMELFVRKRSLDTGMANLTNYTDDQVLELAAGFAEKQGAETYSVYENQYKFAKLEYLDSKLNYYVCEYVTVINKDNYTFTFQSESEFTDWEYEEMKDIIDSIQFDIDTSMKEKNDGGFLDHVIPSAIGGAVVGGVIGGVIGIVNKKKKKAAQEAEASSADTPGLE